MQRGNTIFDTGDAAVDQLEREAYTFPITLTNVTGTFSEGEDFTAAGGASGRDVYTFTIFKAGTATDSYEIFGAVTNYA